MSRPDTRFAERGRGYWSLTLALAFLLLVACTALGPILRGSAWWWVMAAVASITLASAAVFRHLHWARSAVPLAAGGVVLVVLTLFFGAGTGLLWLIPTPATVEIWGGLVESGSLSIQQQAVPAVAYPGIIFLLAIGAGLIAIALDVVGITLRLPAVAGALVLIPAAVPALVTKDGTDVWALALTAAAYLVVLRVDVRTRRRAEAETEDRGRTAPHSFGPERRGPGPVWGSLGVGAIGIVSALVLSAATPALSDSSLISTKSNGVLFGSGVSPLIDLGQDLRRPEATLAFHYGTSSDKAPYFKLLTLDTFSDDLEWVAGTGPIDPTNTVDEFGRAPGLTAATEREKMTTSVQIDGVVSSWLPVPYPATKVSGLDGSWAWDETALTVSSAAATTSGQSYTVEGLLLKPTAEQLKASGTAYPSAVMQYTEVPESTPEIIGATAATLTQNTTNPYDAAIALQRHFRSSVYAYSTKAPVEEGFDGDSLDVIATFLEAKKGYCIHFASAMAIMARTLGIPSRMALGYAPGASTRDMFEGQERWNVTTHDLHTWPELYFPGVGWIPFEPTTGRGSIPDYAQVTGPGITSTTAPSLTPRERQDAGAVDPGRTGAGLTSQSKDATMWVQLGAVILGTLLVLLVPFIARSVRRWRRRRRIETGHRPASQAWAEVVDTALDLGLGVADTETARHLAARLAASGGDDIRGALSRLRDGVEREHYARSADPVAEASSTADLDTVVQGLRRRASVGQRLRAALLPRSLRPEAFGPVTSRRPAPA